MVAQSKRVLNYLLEFVQERETLPNYAMIAAALGIDRSEVSDAVNILRKAGRIEPTTLLPVEYGPWWREHVAARWSYKALRLS